MINSNRVVLVANNHVVFAFDFDARFFHGGLCVEVVSDGYRLETLQFVFQLLLICNIMETKIAIKESEKKRSERFVAQIKKNQISSTHATNLFVWSTSRIAS